VGFGSSDIPDSARVATRHLLQKHFLTPMAAGETPPWMPDSPLGGLASSRAPLSPRFTPNEIQMLLHTLEGGAGGGGGARPPPGRAHAGLGSALPPRAGGLEVASALHAAALRPALIKEGSRNGIRMI